MQKQTNIGTAGAAVDVSDANISAAGLITVSKIDYGDQNSNLVNSSVVSTFSNIGSTSDNQVWTFIHSSLCFRSKISFFRFSKFGFWF